MKQWKTHSNGDLIVSVITSDLSTVFGTLKINIASITIIINKIKQQAQTKMKEIK